MTLLQQCLMLITSFTLLKTEKCVQHLFPTNGNEVIFISFLSLLLGTSNNKTIHTYRQRITKDTVYFATEIAMKNTQSNNIITSKKKKNNRQRFFFPPPFTFFPSH